MYEIVAPNGNVHIPPDGTCWKIIRPAYDKALSENRICFGKDGNGVPSSTLLISFILSTFDFIAFYIDPSLAMS